MKWLITPNARGARFMGPLGRTISNIGRRSRTQTSGLPQAGRSPGQPAKFLGVAKPRQASGRHLIFEISIQAGPQTVQAKRLYRPRARKK